MGAFPTADAGVAAAQTILRTNPAGGRERIRVGVHAGLAYGPVLREGGDVFGSGDPRARIVCEVGGG